MEATTEAIQQTQAVGIAEQLMDEILGKRYMAVGVDPYQTVFSPSSWEMQGQGRERYDDVDDYHDYSASPVEDRWGIELGRGNEAGGLRNAQFQTPSGAFQNWIQRVEVYYVDENQPSVRLSAGTDEQLSGRRGPHPATQSGG